MWSKTAALAADERAATADLIEHLAAVDERRLWSKKDFISLFEYCVHGLRFSEGAAFKRIRAARAQRIYPPIIERLREGRLSLDAVVILHPYLHDADAAALIMKACGLTTRQLERLLAERKTAPLTRDVVRFVGSAAPQPPSSKDRSLFDAPEQVQPVSPVPTPISFGSSEPPSRRVRLAFTADEDFYVLLEKARSMLRHKYPDGRLEGVLGDALAALLEKRDPVLRWKASKLRRQQRTSRENSPLRGTNVGSILRS